MFQRSGGPLIQLSGKRFSNASITASTHSEMGTALAPRAHVSTASPTWSNGNALTPVPKV